MVTGASGFIGNRFLPCRIAAGFEVRAVTSHHGAPSTDTRISWHRHKVIEAHELAPMIRLVEGNSVALEIVDKTAREIKSGDIRSMIILDSYHSREHIATKLEAYYHLVTAGSYIAATDGIMRYVFEGPRGYPEWRPDNPARAVEDFVIKHPEFMMEPLRWWFNESDLDKNITACSSA